MSETEVTQPVVKDWRGKEIKIGSHVLWSGENGTGIGVVHMVLKHSKYLSHVFVNWNEHSSHTNKRSQPLRSDNITVLDHDIKPV